MQCCVGGNPSWEHGLCVQQSSQSPRSALAVSASQICTTSSVCRSWSCTAVGFPRDLVGFFWQDQCPGVPWIPRKGTRSFLRHGALNPCSVPPGCPLHPGLCPPTLSVTIPGHGITLGLGIRACKEFSWSSAAPGVSVFPCSCPHFCFCWLKSSLCLHPGENREKARLSRRRAQV